MAEESNSYGLAWFLARIGVGAVGRILYAPKNAVRRVRTSPPSHARGGTGYLAPAPAKPRRT